MNGIFIVTLIVSRDDYQDNPTFRFEDWSELQQFINLCITNEYHHFEIDFFEEEAK